jgi:hypothetical protein
MLKPLCVLVALLSVSPLVTAEIFKCTRDNNTVYQNFPCSVDSIGSQATATAPPEPAPPAVAPPPAPARAKAEKVADAAPALAGRTEPRVGMTMAQVKASTWGEPISIVKEEVVEGWTEVWKYDFANKRSVMFGTNRRVSEVTQ